MHTEIVDLYAAFGMRREQGYMGYLSCLCLQTSQEVSPKRKRPAVLILPGGGYEYTSDREAEPVAIRFVAKGWAAFVLRYSTAPNRFPTPLREAAMAMIYIRQHCDQFEVDPAQVVAVGFSAGGHLCGMLGTLFDSQEVANIGSSEQIRPNGLGLCYPVAVSWGNTHEDSFRNLTGDDAELTARLSLDHLVRSDMPPVYIWHTRNDTCVPCRNSLILAHALDELDIDFSLRIYHHGLHGLSTADQMVYPTYRVLKTSSDILAWENRMIAFFAECGIAIQDQENENISID